MELNSTIKITKAPKSRASEYDFNNVVFGNNPTDHIFYAEYKKGVWDDGRIEPLQNISISPLALCFHYGQTVFEGMKAFRMANGNINIFRMEKHHARLQRTLERMCMPAIPKELFFAGLHALVDLEKNWIPENANTPLYIRPFMIATEPKIGVKVSEEYLFGVICLPLANYYAGNLKVQVETNYIRAAEGGVGYTKCGGNYGAAFYPTTIAKKKGFDQVLWTDAKNHEYIEESGTMNVMFVIDGTVVTPPLSGTILDGVTRDSLLKIARDVYSLPVEERKISYRELEEAFRSGKKVEAFGCGTAAGVSPIEMIDIHGTQYRPLIGDATTYNKLRNKLLAIRTGAEEDVFNWNYIVEK